MFTRFLATVAGLAASSMTVAQGVVSTDLLWPKHPIPANLRILDVFVDVASTDVWTAAGLRAVTENGATINYFDQEPNTPGMQVGLFNVGVVNKFKTSLSKPRGRDANARFTNAGAAAAGGYDPATPVVVTEPNHINVAWFASPPETSGSPSTDGYIARISVDISGVTPIPGYDIADYNYWGESRVEQVPPGAIVVLRSVPVSEQFGTAIATYDVPALSGISWALWYIPEPSALALLALGSPIVMRRRSMDCTRQRVGVVRPNWSSPGILSGKGTETC